MVTRRERAATHESGHATAAFVLGLPVERAWLAEEWRIVRHGEQLGYVKTDLKWDPDHLKRHCIAALAGSLAEEGVYGVAAGGGSDRARFSALVNTLRSGSWHQMALGINLEHEARLLVHDERFLRLTKVLAAALLEKNSLSGAQVRAILRQEARAMAASGRLTSNMSLDEELAMRRARVRRPKRKRTTKRVETR